MPTYLTLREVCEFTRLSRTAIIEKMQAAEFPAPRKLGPHRRSRLVWRRDEVESWIERGIVLPRG